MWMSSLTIQHCVKTAGWVVKINIIVYILFCTTTSTVTVSTPHIAPQLDTCSVADNWPWRGQRGARVRAWGRAPRRTSRRSPSSSTTASPCSRCEVQSVTMMLLSTCPQGTEFGRQIKRLFSHHSLWLASAAIIVLVGIPLDLPVVAVSAAVFMSMFFFNKVPCYLLIHWYYQYLMF